MNKLLVIGLLCSALFFACKGKDENANNSKTEASQFSAPDTSLIVQENGEYIQYYPGKKNIRFRGKMNDLQQRQGKWSFYDEKGEELSYTHYINGVKEGFSLVKHPNGKIHYHGEYHEDEKAGVWKTYDINGKVVEEVNYTK